jgi:hypothetical protein
MTWFNVDASSAMKTPLWDYPTQDTEPTDQNKAICPTAQAMRSKPSPDVTDLLSRRAAKVTKGTGAAMLYLKTHQRLHREVYSTDGF